MPWVAVDLRVQVYKRDHLRRVAVQSTSLYTYRNKTRTCLSHAKNVYDDTIITESDNKAK